MKKFYFLFVALFTVSSAAMAQALQNETNSNQPLLESKGIKFSASILGGHNYDYNSGGALLNARYKVVPHLSAGIGTGGILSDDLMIIPLYASAHINFFDAQETLFLDFKIGCGISSYTDYFEIYSCNLWGIALGYDFGKMNISYQYLSYGSFYPMRRISAISLGFDF